MMSLTEANGPFVAEIAATWVPVLFDTTIKSVLVLGPALAVLWAFRRASAAARHAILFAAAASLLLLPILSATLPGWNVLPDWTALSAKPSAGMPPTDVSSREQPADTLPITTPPADWRLMALPDAVGPDVIGPGVIEPEMSPRSADIAEVPRANPVDSVDLHDAPSAKSYSATPLAPSPSTERPTPLPSRAWPAWCVLAWFFGASATLFPVALGTLSLWRVERNARRVDQGPLAELFRRLVREMGVRRPVRLLLSDHRTMPMQWGIVRPKLLLPAAAETWPTDRVRAVLIHELAHVGRWDCLAQLLAQLACAMFWLNPLAWIARRRLQIESEAACDDRVLRANMLPADYAEHLLQIVSSLPGRAVLAPGAIGMAGPANLENRLLAILDRERDHGGLSLRLVGTLTIATLLTVIPLAMLRATPQSETEPAAETVVELPVESACVGTDVQKERARTFLDRVARKKFEEAVELFDPALVEVLPASELQKFWRRFVHRAGGSFERALSCEHRQLEHGRVVEARCQWTEAVMLVRWTFDQEDRITGFWLARDPEGPTPESFRKGGYVFGAPMEQITGWLSIEARVVDLDGQPTKEFRVTLWKAAESEAEHNEHSWHDPATGMTWNAVQGGHLTIDRLEPGDYRATAYKGHSPATPVGIGEPVRLDGTEKRTVVTVCLQAGPKVTIRPVDVKTGRPLPKASVWLKPQGDLLPPRWIFRPSRGGDPPSIENVPPGKYTLSGGQSARRPDDLKYELADEPIDVELVAGEDQEFTLPLAGRPLTQAEIDRRWPWVATGTVTDEAGQPVEGVEVRAATGMGTLRGGGSTTTDAAGHYTLRFGGGMWFMINDGKVPVGQQMAIIRARKPGYFEKNLSRHGNRTAANRLPEEDEDYRLFGDPELTILPGKPCQLDFVMLPAATLEVRLVDDRDQPVADQHMPIAGHELPPGSSGLSGGTTDEDGRFKVENIPTGYAWSLTAYKKGSRERPKSPPFAFPRADDYRIEVRETLEAETGVGRLEILGITDSEGTDIRDQVVGDDPFARPPLSPERQAEAREILQRIGEANRYWLTGPPMPAVESYQYNFHLAGKNMGSIRITDPSEGNAWLRQGISYTSAVRHLVGQPEQAVFRMLEQDAERITLVYHLKEPTGITAGNGLVGGTWRGFFSSSVREGKLVVDAKTLAPTEHTAGELRERFSEYVEIDADHRVPLRIQVDKGGMKFDWRFRVHGPGLWLFHTAHTDQKEFADGIVARTENVKLNGEKAVVTFAAEPAD